MLLLIIVSLLLVVLLTDVEYSCIVFLVGVLSCCVLLVNCDSLGYMCVDVVRWFIEIGAWLCSLLLEYGVSFTMFSWLVIVLYMILILFAVVYMSPDVRVVEFIIKYVLFLFSIWVVFSLVSLFCCIVAWELLGIASFFLIGHYVLRSIAVRSAHQALLFNKIGDYFICALSLSISQIELVYQMWALL